jgi:MFS family permease
MDNLLQQKQLKYEKAFFYGWFVAIACFITLLICGTSYYCFGVFFKPLQDEFGWDRTLTSSANTIFLLVYAASSYIMGGLADRYGPRLVLPWGALLLGGGFALCSQIHNIWHLYLFLALAGLGQGTLWSPPLATLQRWFIKRRGLMLGIVTSGVGVGMLIIIPILSQVISAYGWRLAFIFLGAGSFFFLILSSIVMVPSPERKGLQPYGWQEVREPAVGLGVGQHKLQKASQWRTGEAVRTKAFFMVLVLYSAVMISINVIGAHFVRFAIDLGIEQTTAAGAFGVIGGVSILGKITMGGTAERIHWNWSLGICCFGVAVVISSLLAVRNLWMIYVCAAFYGFFYGGTIPLVPGLTGYLFGTRSLSQLIGIVSGVGNSVGSLGPIIAGLIFDKTGSYAVCFVLAAGTLVLAGILAIRVRLPQKASSGR